MRKAKKYNQTISENVVDGKIIDFIIPVGVLIALTVITGDLITAVIGAIVVCAIMYIPRKNYFVRRFISDTLERFFGYVSC